MRLRKDSREPPTTGVMKNLISFSIIPFVVYVIFLIGNIISVSGLHSPAFAHIRYK